MSDPALKTFLVKHGISEEEFKSFDRSTQSQLIVQAHHGEYNIHDVTEKFDKHEYKEAYKAAFYCAPVETVMTTSTVGFILPMAIGYGLAIYPSRQMSRLPFFDGVKARTFLASKVRRTRLAILLGSFVVVNSYLLERMIHQIHK